MFPLLPEHSEKKKLKDNKSFFFRACFHYTFTLANHIIIIKLSRCCKKGCFQIVGMSPICRRTRFACWEERVAYSSFHSFSLYTYRELKVPFVQISRGKMRHKLYNMSSVLWRNKFVNTFISGSCIRDHASRNTICSKVRLGAVQICSRIQHAQGVKHEDWGV